MKKTTKSKKITAKEAADLAAETALLEAEVPFSPDVSVSGRYPTLERLKTGLFSLDSALSYKGNLGLPLRVFIELYGYTNSGKSTLAYFVSGKVASAFNKTTISVADLEYADTQQYLPRATGMGGFKGKIKMMDLSEDDGKPIPHERVLMNLVKSLYFNDDVGAIIWDSIGATQSRAQMQTLFDPKGEFGQSFMGKKPFLVGQVVDAISLSLQTRSSTATAIALNHVHQVIGGRGHTTPGGERKGFLAGARLMIWRGEAFYENDEDPGSRPIGFLVNGQVEKLRFGGPGRKFQYFIVPGYGVHEGVSAMFDAFDLTFRLKKKKINVPYMTAERGTRVKLDGKGLGFLKKDLLTYAADGKRRKFYPFEEIIARFTEDVERGVIGIDELENEDGLSTDQDVETNEED